MSTTIDIESTPAKAPEAQPQSLALQRVESGAVGKALTVEELHERLEYVRQVMQRELREGVDYGKVPGTGDRPTLLQPGAQKLLLTFNLTEAVRKEVLREYPGMHREYEFTVCVRAQNGKEWDGVGTCSTLESKYRWRKTERQCPACGKHTIIAGKEEYGGGWLCWKKKDGCGVKFAFNDPAIASQAVGKTENPDPADCWNTVRKMAFKRALVAAAINATNTSELWTQDLEEGGNGNELEPAAGGTRTGPPPATQRMAPGPHPAATSATNSPKTNGLKGEPDGREASFEDAATAPPRPVPGRKPAYATDKTRAWAVAEVEKGNLLQYLPEWLEATDQLLPSENLQDWPLRFVPVNRAEMQALLTKVTEYAEGKKPEAAFPAHDEPEAVHPEEEPEPPGGWQGAKKPIELPRDPPGPTDDQDAWRTFPMPWGAQAGVPMGDLDKKYLFGLWANYKVETEYKGNPKKPETIAKDQTFRAMLDLAGKHYEFRKPD
jgi:hypothetical protein